MTTPIPTPASLLTRAAAILDERGWTQGFYFNEAGCVCALGAIHAAVAEAAGQDSTDRLRLEFPHLAITADMQPLADAFLKALDAVDAAVPGGKDRFSLAEWNDQRGRTKREVQELLRRAAGGAR